MLCRFSLESLSRQSALCASPSWCPGSDSARGLPSVHWPEGSVRAEDLSLCGAGRGQKGPPCARRRGTLPRPAQEHTGGFVSSGTLRSKPLGPACGELGSCDRPPCQNQPPSLKQTRGSVLFLWPRPEHKVPGYSQLVPDGMRVARLLWPHASPHCYP